VLTQKPWIAVYIIKWYKFNMSILKWGFCFSVMMLTLWACSRLKSQPITDEGAKTNLAGKTILAYLLNLRLPACV
jgi:hypothetical protein